MSNKLGGNQNLAYIGTSANQPPNWTFEKRNPTQYDINNSIGDLWMNTILPNPGPWVLVSLQGTPTSRGPLATWLPWTGGMGDVLSLSGDVGGPVMPTAGNINTIGANGIYTTGTPGTSTLTTVNLRDVAAYVVNPVAGVTGYNTIQSAINQAVIDGASASNPVTIWIWPGTYTENLSITSSGINLVGSSDQKVIIVGNALLQPSEGHTQFSNLTFTASGGPALTISGSLGGLLELDFCTINATVASGLICANSLAVINLYLCSLYASSTYRNLAIGSCDRINISYTNFISVDTASTFSGSGEINIKYCFVRDCFNVSGTGTFHFNNNSTATVGTLSTFTIGVDATFNCFGNTIFGAPANGFWATGTGNIFDGNNVITTSSGSIDTGLTRRPQPTSVGNLSFDGGLTKMTTNGQLIIGNTAGQPKIATLIQGSGVTITNGNGSISIASNGPSSYATGNWTPILTFGAGGVTGITYATQLGTYIKIGNLVYVSCNIVLTSKGSDTGIANITNLPYPINNTALLVPMATEWDNITLDAGYTIAQGIGVVSNGFITINEYGSGVGGANLMDTNFANNSAIIISGTYFTT